MRTTNTNPKFSKIGLPPGTLQHIGNIKPDKVKISIIDYYNEDYKEFVVEQLEDIYQYKNTQSNTWINIDGLHDISLIETIGSHFDIHNLILEDILNTQHRPKLEEDEGHLFFTLKMMDVNEHNHVVTEQVSMVLGDNWLLTFQEQEGDLFDKIRIRLRDTQAKIRKKGVDYLFYALIDIIVDNYFIVIEHFKDKTEAIEDRVLLSPYKKQIIDLQIMRKQLIAFRKALDPLREALTQLKKDSYALINKRTQPYISDVYEHTLFLYESTEYLQESLSNVLELYHMGISSKTNQIMQVLTIIATIFIPLTFIVGVYGMNFESMPEIHWKYGYLYVWILMILIILGMLAYFKKKKWL